MKIKKRVTIIVDVLVDEDFDTKYLCICQDMSDQINLDSYSLYVGRSNDFELMNYIYQDEVEIAE